MLPRIARYWGDLLLLLFTYWRFTGSCAAMLFFFANLRFHCLERFTYTIISFVLVCFCLTFHVLLFVICRTLFRAVINWICCFVYFFSLQLYCPVIDCADFAYPPPLFVSPICGPSIPQCASNVTSFYRTVFFFYSLHLVFLLHCSNLNPSISSYRSCS